MSAGPAPILRDVLESGAVWRQVERDPDFAAVGSWFDGIVVIEEGAAAWHVKIYKAKVVECARGHGYLGYTFALQASSAAWEDILASRTSLHAALARGDVRPRGNLIEFSRMLRLVTAVVGAWVESWEGKAADARA